MALTPLQILQGYNNTALQALTTEQLTAAIELATPEVARAAYGNLWAAQVADLAAHDLISEIDMASPGSGGSSQPVAEVAVGKRRVRYSTVTTTYTLDPRSDEGLQRTIYGQRFIRRRAQCAVGGLTTGMII